jgi:Acetyltransferase (GNAT) domain
MHAKKIDINWNPTLSIYASEPYLESVGDDYGWIGGFDESDKLCCILPYTIIHMAIFKIIRFRIETIRIDDSFSVEKEKDFLAKATSLFRSFGADFIAPASNNTLFRTYPDGAVAAPYGSYVVDLTQTEEQLWNNLHQKHRNVIRNAQKKNVQIKIGTEHLDAVYNTIQETLKRSAMKFMSRAAFEKKVSNLGENVKLIVAEHDGKLQGAAMIPFSDYSAYYVYGGSVPNPLTGAINFLHWEAMRMFRQAGVRRYDFVGVRVNPEKGSKQDNLRMFKERFGGNLEKGFMWKYSFHPIKYALYCLAARIRSGGDIVDHERHKL